MHTTLHAARVIALLTTLTVAVAGFGMSCTPDREPPDATGSGHAGDSDSGTPDSGAGAVPARPSASDSPPPPDPPPPPEQSPFLPEPTPSATAMEPLPEPQVPCNFEFSVETTAHGAKYAPRNAGVIWITDTAGVGIRVLERWGIRSERYLTRWQTTRGALDIVSAGSHSQYGAHHVSWDCTDANGQLVPFGTYIVHVQIASSRVDSPYFSVAFEHSGTTPLEETVAPIRAFRGGKLRYQPGNGAVGAAPEQVCKESSMSVLDWCEMSTSCPGSLEQVSCTQVSPDQTDCTCSTTTELERPSVSGVPIQEACAAAHKQCQTTPSAGPLVSCLLEPGSYLPPETPVTCSLQKRCSIPGASQAGTWRGTTIDCRPQGSDWSCNCSPEGIPHSFFFSLERSPGALPSCGELVDSCEESVTFNGPVVCNPPSVSITPTTCVVSEECTQSGVTASGRAVFRRVYPRRSSCRQLGDGSATWYCSCNYGPETQVVNSDVNTVCLEAFASCLPHVNESDRPW
ncbi:MAG: hypothetical protein RJA70_4899 [Pseudomonadota bacterium]|jgi:hypothetical protein